MCKTTKGFGSSWVSAPSQELLAPLHVLSHVHHVSCDSHLRSHAYIVFLIASLFLKQALVCLSDVMSHLQAKTF